MDFVAAPAAVGMNRVHPRASDDVLAGAIGRVDGVVATAAGERFDSGLIAVAGMPKSVIVVGASLWRLATAGAQTGRQDGPGACALAGSPTQSRFALRSL